MIGSAVIGAGANVAGNLMGMIGAKRREKRQVKNQKKLMDHQKGNQERLNEQGQRLQMQTWKETNYPAQVEMMKEAGLNPGLLMGGSGGGGATATAGGQGGGSASSGAASQGNPMELGAAMQAVTTAGTLALQKAQARKTNAEAHTLEKDLVTDDAWRQGERRSKYQLETEKARQDTEVLSRRTGDNEDTDYMKGEAARIEKMSIDAEIAKEVKAGTISDNEVKAYRAGLAKAKIDPDSNPMIRELMKAMAANGIPLSEVLRKIVKMFM